MEKHLIDDFPKNSSKENISTKNTSIRKTLRHTFSVF